MCTQQVWNERIKKCHLRQDDNIEKIIAGALEIRITQEPIIEIIICTIYCPQFQSIKSPGKEKRFLPRFDVYTLLREQRRITSVAVLHWKEQDYHIALWLSYFCTRKPPSFHDKASYGHKAHSSTSSLIFQQPLCHIKFSVKSEQLLTFSQTWHELSQPSFYICYKICL